MTNFSNIILSGIKTFYAVEYLIENSGGNVMSVDGYPAYTADKEEAQDAYDAIEFCDNPDGCTSSKELVRISITDVSQDVLDNLTDYCELPVSCYSIIANKQNMENSENPASKLSHSPTSSTIYKSA